MKINEIVEKTQLFNVPFLVAAKKEGITNTSSPYLSITLRDNTGTIEGKLWSVTEAQSAIVKTGKVIGITGEALLYRNSLQLKIIDVKEIDEKTVNMQDFVLTGPYSAETLREGIEKAIKSIQNQDIFRIVSEIYSEYDEQIYSSAAATKNHHEYYGGLATHVYSMLKLADMICTNYPYLNRDLVIAGVLLHDIGKVFELASGTVTEYTVEGRLLGHISISQTIVKETADHLGIKSEAVTLLRHMILSHHGQYEFGSPVLPCIIEAEALHMIDDMDAKMVMIEKELRSIPENEFTQRNFALDNRSFFKHQ